MLIVDLSRAMDEKDLAPSRLQLTLTLLDGFLAEFFDQNPISQLGIVITRDAVARRLTELGGALRPAMRVTFRRSHCPADSALFPTFAWPQPTQRSTCGCCGTAAP